MAGGRNRKDLSKLRVRTDHDCKYTEAVARKHAVARSRPKRRRCDSTLHYRCPANVIAATSGPRGHQRGNAREKFGGEKALVHRLALGVTSRAVAL